MRNVWLLLGSCAVFVFALPAMAGPMTGQISFGGYAESVGSAGMGASTGVDFANGYGVLISGSSGGVYSFGSGTGSFASLSCAEPSGDCGSIEDLSSFASEPATADFLTLDLNGSSLVFNLDSIQSVVHASDLSGGSVTFTALGTIDFAGYSPTIGELILTAQGNNYVSYSATLLTEGAVPVSPTPEPSSLVLLAAPMVLLMGQRWRLARKI